MRTLAQTVNNFTPFISVAFIAAATFFGVTTAKADPPPGPRSTNLAPWFHSLQLPQKGVKLTDVARIKLLLAEIDTMSFMEALGASKSPRSGCCGAADCREVMSEKHGGDWNEGYVAILPEAPLKSRYPEECLYLQTQ